MSWDTVSPGYRPLSWGYAGVPRMPPVSQDANSRFQTYTRTVIGSPINRVLARTARVALCGRGMQQLSVFDSSRKIYFRVLFYYVVEFIRGTECRWRGVAGRSFLLPSKKSHTRDKKRVSSFLFLGTLLSGQCVLFRSTFFATKLSLKPYTDKGSTTDHRNHVLCSKV